MIADGTYTAVVDRIENELATLQVEIDDERPAELVIDADRLPDPAQHADAVLDVTVRDGEPADMTYDAAATEERREQAQTRFDRLADRLPRDDE